MIVGLGTQPNLLHLDNLLLLACFAFLTLLLVLELAKVHNAANRRVGIGRNFDQIEIALFGNRQGFTQGDDTEVLIGVGDNTHFTGAYLVINSQRLLGAYSSILSEHFGHNRRIKNELPALKPGSSLVFAMQM